MELIYHVYGSAKIGFRTSNQALLEVFDGCLKITTFHGVFLFEKDDLIKIHERKFLFGVFKSIKIVHVNKAYHKRLFFLIPPFTGQNYKLLKQALCKANLPAV